MPIWLRNKKFCEGFDAVGKKIVYKRNIIKNLCLNFYNVKYSFFLSKYSFFLKVFFSNKCRFFSVWCDEKI